MEWMSTKEKIENHLIELEEILANPIECYNEIIIYCQNKLEIYRSEVIKHGFPDLKSEIEFFKEFKPHLLGLLIQYDLQLSFLLDYQACLIEELETFIKREVEKINHFFSVHREIVTYMQLNRSEMDEFYFLRKSKKSVSCVRSYRFGYDKHFTTSHDTFVAEINAYTRYLIFLKRQLAPSSKDILAPAKKLDWTGSKVALTELGFALHHSKVIGNGNTSLKVVMDSLENFTGVKLGDYHHTSIRFRNRSNPTKFLTELQEGLTNWIENLDD